MNIRKVIREELQFIFEDINIPVEVGDEILTGKFKNKKTTVKSIDKNEKGDITINDKPALKFRIPEKIKESTSSHITCKNCGWEWDIEPEDKNPHLCHKCGYDNKKMEFDNVSLEAWKSENDLR
jgi:predicted nucleic-acid-binding Zn-ribbon protein